MFLRVTRAGLPEATAGGQRAWVFRIARNLALNHVRDGHRRPVVNGLTESAAPATQELGVALRLAIAALPGPDRDVFLLREIAGLRYDEIAVACEMPLEAVRARLHQARQALRAALGPELDVRAQRGLRCLSAGENERTPRRGGL